MLSDARKNILRAIFLCSILFIVVSTIFRTWSWREDHFKLFDLSKELQKNDTDFYTWLGVKPTATSVEIGKAHRRLVLKLHPETSKEENAQEKFEITNQVAYILRSSTLRPLYDSILQKKRLPYFKGLFYYYSRYKLFCMAILGVFAMSLMEYLKAWDKYLTDKVAFDQFIKNAKIMAQKISDKHASAQTHKSYIDLGDRIIECEITQNREIFLFNDKKERVPLSSSNLLPFPSLLNVAFIRISMNLIGGNKTSKANKSK